MPWLTKINYRRLWIFSIRLGVGLFGFLELGLVVLFWPIFFSELMAVNLLQCVVDEVSGQRIQLLHGPYFITKLRLPFFVRTGALSATFLD